MTAQEVQLLPKITVDELATVQRYHESCDRDRLLSGLEVAPKSEDTILAAWGIHLLGKRAAYVYLWLYVMDPGDVFPGVPPWEARTRAVNQRWWILHILGQDFTGLAVVVLPVVRARLQWINRAVDDGTLDSYFQFGEFGDLEIYVAHHGSRTDAETSCAVHEKLRRSETLAGKGMAAISYNVANSLETMRKYSPISLPFERRLDWVWNHPIPSGIDPGPRPDAPEREPKGSRTSPDFDDAKWWQLRSVLSSESPSRWEYRKLWLSIMAAAACALWLCWRFLRRRLRLRPAG